MSRLGRAISGGVVLMCVILLSACSSMTPVQEITADKDGYLAKNFSVQAMSPEVAKKLPGARSAGNFGTLKMSVSATTEQSDGKKETFKNVMTFVDKGNGLVQRMSELSNNDIPYALLYSLTFRNMIDLRWQNVPLRGRLSSPLFEIKSIERINDALEGPGGEFAFEFTSGAQGQIGNFATTGKSCKATKDVAASELHPNLPGRALELECELHTNKVLQYKTRMVYLKQYGFAVLIELVRSSRKTKYRIDDVGS